MKIALCVTCKGRTQHLERTLPLNLHYNSTHAETVVIVLNYNSRDHLEDYLYARHRQDMKRERLSTYRFTEPTAFRMAHAKNLAHRLAIREGASVLVNLDADNFTGQDFSHYLDEKFDSGERIFLWANMIKGKMPRGISGRIAVRKDAFLSVGGYDEKFSTWSPDDKDFNLRLRQNDWQGQEIEPQYLEAINHTDRMRFKEYPEAREDMDSAEFELTSVPTVANAGKFGCGVVYRNFEPEPIEVNPVPSRIFGIGLHKTGTTSLHQALSVLGYDSAHWKSAHWAKKIWEEMMTEGRSPVLEKNYALSDIPICLLYKELDKAYPGAKFILTVRNEEKWIESVRKHWSIQNPYRSQWDTDPFTHKSHRLLYGMIHFNREVFLSRYRRHNDEVKEYFKDRRQDLLIMDMDDNAGWYELCGFLKKPIPSIPYPRRNQSQ